MTDIIINYIGLLTLIAGFIIGLGAVIVIDIHGLLARRSVYWTEATIRTHKVTKPMIWVGIFLVLLGSIIFYDSKEIFGLALINIQLFIIGILVLNGFFLSFYVSPYLIRMERSGRTVGTEYGVSGSEGDNGRGANSDDKLLPAHLQKKIFFSLILSDIGWWGSVLILVWVLVSGV